MQFVLAISLVAAIFIGGIVFNSVTPMVFGLPLFFAWTLFSVLLISSVMLVIYKLDPLNSKGEDE